jgi:hypothetical protein
MNFNIRDSLGVLRLTIPPLGDKKMPLGILQSRRLQISKPGPQIAHGFI